MKIAVQESKSKIINFLSKHPNSDAKAIEIGTSIPRAVVFATMRELSIGNQVSVFQKNVKSIKLFAMVNMPSVDKAKKDKEIKTEKVAVISAIKKQNVDTKVKTNDDDVDKQAVVNEGKNFGRDFSKYSFNGMNLRKGRCAHEIIKDVLTRKNATFKEAMDICSPDMVRRYGPFALLAVARKVNNAGPQRYNGNVIDHITLKCGTVICTTNQWSKHNIGEVLEMGRKFGCKIEEPTV